MTIFIRHDSLPMQTITVGRASALNLTVIGVPANVENVLLHVSTPGAVETYTPVAADPGKDGRWSIYATGVFFPEAGLAKYHITGRDDKGNSVWLGGGRLNILQSG